MNDSYDGDDVVVNDSGEDNAESSDLEATTETTPVTSIDDAKEGHGNDAEGGRHTITGEPGGSKTGETGAGGRSGEAGSGSRNADAGEPGGAKTAEGSRGGKQTETDATQTGKLDLGRKNKAEPGKDDKTAGENASGMEKAELGRDGKSDGKDAVGAGKPENAAGSEKSGAGSKEKAPDAEKKENAEARPGSEKTEEDKPGKYPPQEVVTIDGQRYRTDDNGHIHMFYDRDTKEWNMIANNEYTSHGYKYRTDDNGDIVHAEGKIDRSGDRKPLNDKVPGLEPGDDRGHIIADRNDASNHRDNLFPQLSEKNRGEYKAMENHVAEAAADPENDVRMSVDLEYPQEGDKEHRPDWVYVTVTINGREEHYTFDNRRDA